MSGDIGLNVLSAPVGVQVHLASYIGVQVNSAGGAGVFADLSGSNGFQVYSAGNDGVKVQSAAENGLGVDFGRKTAYRFLRRTTTVCKWTRRAFRSISYFSPSSDGLEVAGVRALDFYIGRADIDGNTKFRSKLETTPSKSVKAASPHPMASTCQIPAPPM